MSWPAFLRPAAGVAVAIRSLSFKGKNLAIKTQDLLSMSTSRHHSQ